MKLYLEILMSHITTHFTDSQILPLLRKKLKIHNSFKTMLFLFNVYMLNRLFTNVFCFYLRSMSVLRLAGQKNKIGISYSYLLL